MNELNTQIQQVIGSPCHPLTAKPTQSNPAQPDLECVLGLFHLPLTSSVSFRDKSLVTGLAFHPDRLGIYSAVVPKP